MQVQTHVAKAPMLLPGAALTMTSREIADLVGSRHDNVRVAIERLAERGVISLPATQENQSGTKGGRPGREYIFSGPQGKRDSIVVVAQLSPEFTAALVDRWQELEEGRAQPALMTPVSQAQELIQAGLAVAHLFEVPTHLAQAEAVKHARLLTGIDFSGYLLMAPAQDRIAEEEVMLEPTELAKRLGVSRNNINPLLAEWGLQRNVNGEWTPTEEGKRFSARHQWVKANKSGYNLKWTLAEVLRRYEAMDE